MAPSRVIQNWNEDGLAWRVTMAFSEKVRKDEWSEVIQSLRAQGYSFSESALRYVETKTQVQLLSCTPLQSPLSSRSSYCPATSSLFDLPS